jgi:Uma2 family endonuclease
MVLGDKTKPITMEEFIEFALRPENSTREFEFLNGEVVEVFPTTTYRSHMAMLIAVATYAYCKDHDLPCYTSGAYGAYHVQGNIVMPKFAYKPTPMSDDYPDPVPPLWVADIISPFDKANDIRAKRDIYMQAGILYWQIYQPIQKVDIYAPGQAMRTVGIDGVLGWW